MRPARELSTLAALGGIENTVWVDLCLKAREERHTRSCRRLSSVTLRVECVGAEAGAQDTFS